MNKKAYVRASVLFISLSLFGCQALLPNAFQNAKQPQETPAASEAPSTISLQPGAPFPVFSSLPTTSTTTLVGSTPFPVFSPLPTASTTLVGSTPLPIFSSLPTGSFPIGDETPTPIFSPTSFPSTVTLPTLSPTSMPTNPPFTIVAASMSVAPLVSLPTITIMPYETRRLVARFLISASSAEDILLRSIHCALFVNGEILTGTELSSAEIFLGGERIARDQSISDTLIGLSAVPSSLLTIPAGASKELAIYAYLDGIGSRVPLGSKINVGITDVVAEGMTSLSNVAYTNGTILGPQLVTSPVEFFADPSSPSGSTVPQSGAELGRFLISNLLGETRDVRIKAIRVKLGSTSGNPVTNVKAVGIGGVTLGSLDALIADANDGTLLSFTETMFVTFGSPIQFSLKGDTVQLKTPGTPGIVPFGIAITGYTIENDSGSERFIDLGPDRAVAPTQIL